MLSFQNLSIKKKLVFVSMLTSAVALVFTLMVVFSGAFFATRTTIRERISSLARVIGTNCKAAIVFEDPAAAGETLKALIAEPQIDSARIYKADGTLFAQYFREAAHESAAGLEHPASSLDIRDAESWEEIHYRSRDGALEVAAPIELDRKIIGVVVLSSDLKELYRRTAIVAASCLAVLFFSFLVSYVVATLAQRTISGPIFTLTQTMATVSRKKDYALRVPSGRKDELGMLFNGFNTMLAEIQARDEKLHFTQFSVDHIQDAAYWMDGDGLIVNANQPACDALGYSRETLLTMNINAIDPSFGRERWKEIWGKARQRKTLTFESDHVTKDQKIFPVEVYANFLQFQSREYLCAFARDITDRKKLQMQLAQAQKMEAIGTLAGGVAHDLNNILGGLVGYPDLLLMGLPAESPLRKPLTTIKKSGEKAGAIVQDLLTLARRGVDIRVAVNLNDIVAEYLKSPEHERIRKFHPNVRIDIDLETDLPNILGSELHLSKTVMNLVSNAAEAIQASGRIMVTTLRRRIESPVKAFQTIAEGDYAVLRVEDNGIGISAKDMANIFEPFYTKKKMGRSGTGLGMSVVSGTVKDHKGFIDLQSAQGNGTRFALYFPITHQLVQDKQSNFNIENYMGTEKILVVDDVEEQREIATVVLTKLGYRVATVSAGQEAVDYVRQNPVDLLVLDMIMEPGMDGLETYQRILKIHPRQKAIVASGFAETERVRQIITLGAGAHVRKPYSIEKLAIAVREALGK